MATSTTRTVTIASAGDIISGETFSATPNTSTPRLQDVVSLSSGNNTITVPSSGTAVPNALTIIPPASNGVQLTLKGVNGDTGIAIHLTDPTTIALGSAVTSLVISAASNISGLRFLWT